MPDNSIVFFRNRYYPSARQGANFDVDFNFPHEKGVAFFNESAFFASGINEGGNVHYTNTPNPSMAALKEWVTKSFGDTEPIESAYKPGTVYKRIYRPLSSIGNFYRAIPQEKFTESFVSLRILLNKLEELFETIEPTQTNLSTYGHKIREVLLLACMEVESSWSAVLKENEYSTSGQLTTRDYVKLLKPMLLDCYELSLQSYPRFPSFKPFAYWDATNSTQSLEWYDAYNKTKHDREDNLRLATLYNTIQAVGATVIMFHAQFGFNFGLTGMDQKGPIIRNIFRVVPTFQNHWQ